MRNIEACSLEIEFTLRPGKRREFARSFEDLMCHEGEGHVRTTVYEDRDEPGHMIWIASWASRGTLEEYMRGESFGVLIGGLRILSADLSCRLVDDFRTPVSNASIPEERKPRETRFTPIDLSTHHNPKS